MSMKRLLLIACFKIGHKMISLLRLRRWHYPPSSPQMAKTGSPEHNAHEEMRQSFE